MYVIGCLFFPVHAALAQSSGGHGEHGGNGGAGGMACQKFRLTKNKLVPEPLSEAAPGSALSFLAFGVDDPDHLEVLIKKIPVKIDTEFKDTFYRVSGHLPPELKNTAARITVKYHAKNPKCAGEDGWLIKISE
ncbi:MAG: hypothetical protein CVV13_05180 [Gammaproteobacteria bacterium HGW-Gammaproteobacteria-3]|nr:MAG: hypothetical protein CVV13_05180 [Gammaproteobacteria bacterium HGW-Gammaproteobacteria-3]